ncbi:MAG: GNAT family N-acetyltransferase [Canibacter sp.]
MARYESLTAAQEDGFTFDYDADGSRFLLVKNDTQVGVAHFSDFGEIVRDFNHTVIDPDFRGNGLSTLLAQYALTHPTTKGKKLAASCWFIQGVIEKRPQILDDNGRATGEF